MTLSERLAEIEARAKRVVRFSDVGPVIEDSIRLVAALRVLLKETRDGVATDCKSCGCEESCQYALDAVAKILAGEST